MAISGPYVHSNYANFAAQVSHGALFGAEEGEGLSKYVTNITNSLGVLEQQLKAATEAALGGLSVNDLNDYFFNPYKSLLGVAFSVLKDPNVQKEMVNVLVRDAFILNKEGVIDKLIKDENIPAIGEALNIYELSNELASALIPPSDEKTKVNISNLNGLLKIKYKGKKLSKGTGNKKYLAKVIRDILKEEGIVKPNPATAGQNGGAIYEIFKEAFLKELRDTSAYNEDDAKNFLVHVKNNFSNSIVNFSSGTKSAASGDITEKIGWTIHKSYEEYAGNQSSIQLEFTGA